ncbi:hypothetical protein KKG55_05445, partial [Candidatus Micrarchaeota archaeon]|nr:hypothetical protein [Candidatus Micrarchaeota archaeon]
MPIVHYALGGKGLGHINRLTTIANAIGRQAPGVEQIFITKGISTGLSETSRFPIIYLPVTPSAETAGLVLSGKTLTSTRFSAMLTASILSCSPEVVVYDYLLSAAVLERVYAAGVKNVLILRDKKESTMLDLL